MNKTYEFIAKTADEAIDKALLELNCSLSDLDIEILEHKASGLFGFLKPKEIKIVAKFKEEYLKEKQKELAKTAPKGPSTAQVKSVSKEGKAQKQEKFEKQERIEKPEVKKPQKPESKTDIKADGASQKPEKTQTKQFESKQEKQDRQEAKQENKVQRQDKPEVKSQEKSLSKVEVDENKTSKQEAKQEFKPDLKSANDVKDHGESMDMDFEEDDRNNRKSVEITDLTPEERTRIKDLAYEFVMDLLDSMQIDAEITLIEKRQQLLVLLNIKEGKQLIGYRGETLFAIQYLLSVYMNYKMDKYLRIKLDINNYRKKKEIELKRRVMSVAKKVEKTNRPIKLEEMHASDRHFIHMQLKRNKKVYTKSEGVEPNRCVVILPAEN